MKHGLITLRATEGLNTGKLPDRLKILPWGTSDTRYGKITVGPITLAALPANQAAAKFDHVAIDYQHNSVPGTKFYVGEPVQLAARLATPEVVEGEGLFLSAIDWLADVETLKSYPDLSACVKTDKAGNVTFLHSCAAARQGEVDGITLPLAADPFNNTINTDGDSMDFKKLLIAILGLEETATDAEIEAAAKKFGEAEGQEPEHKELSAAIEVALKPLAAEIATLKGADVFRERAQIITLAAAAGKVVPASVLPDKDGKGGLDNAALKLFVAELPVTVPLEKRTAANGPLHTLSALPAGLAGEGEQIRQSMGISKDRWEKQD